MVIRWYDQRKPPHCRILDAAQRMVETFAVVEVVEQWCQHLLQALLLSLPLVPVLPS